MYVCVWTDAPHDFISVREKGTPKEKKIKETKERKKRGLEDLAIRFEFGNKKNRCGLRRLGNVHWFARWDMVGVLASDF